MPEPVETQASQVVVNRMTQEQYNQITPSDTEFYLITDGADIDEIAEELNSKADTTLSNVSSIDSDSAVQTALDDKVSKSGDTMTGQLTIHRGVNEKLVLKDSRITLGTTPSSHQYSYMRYLDKDENSLAGMYYRYGSNGDVSLRLYTTSSDGESTAALYVGFDSSGAAYCSFPKCTTKATTTSSATASRVAVIVQNYLNGTSWYRVWSDGWIEQGGCVDKSSSGASSFTVSFLKSFKNTNYFIAVTDRGNDNDTGGYDDQHVAVNGSSSSSYDFGLKTTGFRCSSSGSAHKFNWYTCGY